MALPVPNLDDRRFQDLVDDAKRLVQQRCPSWTDHNVSDPGVTLIETFAYMVDQLLYRLNRVPDRHYVKFLELIGVRLFPPTAARTKMTFWLSSPQPVPVTVPAGALVATPPGDLGDTGITFTTTRRLVINPCELSRLCSVIDENLWRDHTDGIKVTGIHCFSAQPRPGDVLLFGLSQAVPGCMVILRLDCQIEGVGVDPEHPPLAWEAFDGEGWVPCEVAEDGTGGLNRSGDIVLYVPFSHAGGLVRRLQAGWLRCRVTAPEAGQPFYSGSPEIRSATAFTAGGVVEAVHAEPVTNEIIGLSEGVAGQRFSLARRPVVPSEEPLVLEVAGGSGWEEWTQVEHFADSGPEDRHFLLDPTGGEVVLGPVVRLQGGDITQHGAVPPKGVPVRVRSYWTGGGRRGNVAAGALRICRTSIPFVNRVENRWAASGGVDGEEIENAKVRGPLALRDRGRAVTAEDYEHLARSAAPEVARVRCVPAEGPVASGGVRLLVVPPAEDEAGRLRLEQLVPSEELLARIAAHLDARRTIGARLVIEPPAYQGVTVVAQVRGQPGVEATRLEEAVTECLYGYLHPISGGPDGDGWPFGRPVQIGELYALLQRLPSVDLVADLRLFGADPLTGDRGPAVSTLPVVANALVFSYEHQVLAEAT